MVSEPLDLAILWNAKAGCTFAVKWLYYHEGVLEEARAFAPWPHDYRQQVYCRRPGYDEQVARIPAMGRRAIKFVRDPFDRAVSGYLFFCQWARPREVQGHGPMLAAIGSHLGRHVGDGDVFTFREFVSFLGSIDLDTADIHIRRQISTCERLGGLPDMTIVRIEESAVVLPALEAELGLRHARLEELRSSNHHTTRRAFEGFMGDVRFDQTLGVAVPTSESFYDDALVDAVARLYAEDIEAYGYLPSGLGVRG